MAAEVSRKNFSSTLDRSPGGSFPGRKRPRDDGLDGLRGIDSLPKKPRTDNSSNYLSYKSMPPGPPAPFQKPLPLLTFSYNSERELLFDNSAMKYYRDPPRNADLNEGVERWIKRPEERTRLDSLLRAFERLKTGNVMEMGAICWRGVMTKYVARS
jgi:RAT1-interacting protein